MKPPDRCRITYLIVVLIVTVSGCGDKTDSKRDTLDDPSPPTSTAFPTQPAPTATSLSPAQAPSSAPPPATAGPVSKSARIVAWIKDLGPLGGGSGPSDAAFSSIVNDKCTAAITWAKDLSEPVRSLYEGTGSACLAAFHGQPQRWSRAEAALVTVTSRRASLDCFGQATFLLLKQLVDLHRTDPNRPLRKGKASPGSGPRCPQILTVDPDHGPAAGGYPVRINGIHLPTSVGIHFGNVYRRVTSTKDGREAIVIAPPRGAQEEQVSVWPDGWPYQAMNSARFSYDHSPDAAVSESLTNSN